MGTPKITVLKDGISLGPEPKDAEAMWRHSRMARDLIIGLVQSYGEAAEVDPTQFFFVVEGAILSALVGLWIGHADLSPADIRYRIEHLVVPALEAYLLAHGKDEKANDGRSH